MEALNHDLLQHILVLLPLRERLTSAELVSRSWLACGRRPLLWQCIELGKEEVWRDLVSPKLLHQLITFSTGARALSGLAGWPGPSPIRRIDMRHCKLQFDVRELRTVLDLCPRLEELDVSNTRRVHNNQPWLLYTQDLVYLQHLLAANSYSHLRALYVDAQIPEAQSYGVMATGMMRAFLEGLSEQGLAPAPHTTLLDYSVHSIILGDAARLNALPIDQGSQPPVSAMPCGGSKLPVLRVRSMLMLSGWPKAPPPSGNEATLEWNYWMLVCQFVRHSAWLERVVVRSNHLSNEGAQLLFREIEAHPCVSEVALASDHLDHRISAAIARCAGAKLQELRLAIKGMGASVVNALASAMCLPSCKLQRVAIDETEQVTAEGAERLLRAAAQCRSLQMLRMRINTLHARLYVNRRADALGISHKVDIMDGSASNEAIV